MRKILAAIRKIAMALTLPVVAFIDGAWRVIQSLRPQLSTALEDAADEVLDEAPSSRTVAREAYDAMQEAATNGEEARVRRAAQAILRREPVPTDALDPNMGRHARLLEWLRGLNVEELATIVQMRPERLTQHLAGYPGAPLPPVRETTQAANDVSEKLDAVPTLSRRRAA